MCAYETAKLNANGIAVHMCTCVFVYINYDVSNGKLNFLWKLWIKLCVHFGYLRVSGAICVKINSKFYYIQQNFNFDNMNFYSLIFFSLLLCVCVYYALVSNFHYTVWNEYTRIISQNSWKLPPHKRKNKKKKNTGNNNKNIQQTVIRITKQLPISLPTRTNRRATYYKQWQHCLVTLIVNT